MERRKASAPRSQGARGRLANVPITRALAVARKQKRLSALRLLGHAESGADPCAKGEKSPPGTSAALAAYAVVQKVRCAAAPCDEVRTRRAHASLSARPHAWHGAMKRLLCEAAPRVRALPTLRRTAVAAGAGLRIVSSSRQDRRHASGGSRAGRQRHVRLHHRRRRQRRLRAGASSDRVGPPSRPAHRGRRRGPQHLDSHPARLRKTVRQPEGQLALQHGARARAQRSPHHPAARQGAGRIELDQRPALHPRPARGFRPLAPARQCRLEFRGRASYFRRAEDQERGEDAWHGVGDRWRSPMCASRIRCARLS